MLYWRPVGAATFCIWFGLVAGSATQSADWEILNRRATQLQENGRYAEAKSVFLDAWKLAERFSPDDPRRPIALNNLASVCQDLGEAAAARDYYERTIAAFERTHGKEHPVLARPLHNLATLYLEEGQYAKAERLRRRALALHVDGQELSEADRIMIWHGLAAAVLGQGRRDEAETIYRRLLAEWDAKTAAPARESSEIRNDLAVLCAETKRLPEAELLLKRVVAETRQSAGKDHPALIKPLSNLASVYSMTGRPSEAEPVLRDALGIAERALGEGEAYGRILMAYAAVLRKLDRRTEAKDAERRAKAILSAVRRDPSLSYTVDAGDLLARRGH